MGKRSGEWSVPHSLEVSYFSLLIREAQWLLFSMDFFNKVSGMGAATFGPSFFFSEEYSVDTSYPQYAPSGFPDSGTINSSV